MQNNITPVNRADMRKWRKINTSFFWIVSLKFLNLLMKKSMRLIRRLKKLSAAQKKLKTENLAKNGMPNPLAYIHVEIGVIPLYAAEIKSYTSKAQSFLIHPCINKQIEWRKIMAKLMQLTNKQIQLAQTIDNWVKTIEKQGGGDTELLQKSFSQMATFKELLDTTTHEQMDILCETSGCVKSHVCTKNKLY